MKCDRSKQYRETRKIFSSRGKESPVNVCVRPQKKWENLRTLMFTDWRRKIRAQRLSPEEKNLRSMFAVQKNLRSILIVWRRKIRAQYWRPRESNFFRRAASQLGLDAFLGATRNAARFGVGLCEEREGTETQKQKKSRSSFLDRLNIS